MSERLFSYGTLRDAAIQRRLFGRLIAGVPDAVMGYRLAKITIADPDSSSGRAEHLIIDPTGDLEDIVEGHVLEVMAEDLRIADVYETDVYKRVRAPLRSGRGECWVYVRA
ncbi:MAG TPA: gamma-glutamylcyclotransferase family protein [Rhizomicrobium sp.]|nr:gamma-glutamylcyclotransferase family protein [Rhizomicrobium sp.]